MHSKLTRGVRPRLEGKPRTPLSCRVATGISWSPLRGVFTTHLVSSHSGHAPWRAVFTPMASPATFMPCLPRRSGSVPPSSPMPAHIFNCLLGTSRACLMCPVLPCHSPLYLCAPPLSGNRGILDRVSFWGPGDLGPCLCSATYRILPRSPQSP